MFLFWERFSYGVWTSMRSLPCTQPSLLIYSLSWTLNSVTLTYLGTTNKMEMNNILPTKHSLLTGLTTLINRQYLHILLQLYRSFANGRSLFPCIHFLSSSLNFLFLSNLYILNNLEHGMGLREGWENH